MRRPARGRSGYRKRVPSHPLEVVESQANASTRVARAHASPRSSSTTAVLELRLAVVLRRHRANAKHLLRSHCCSTVCQTDVSWAPREARRHRHLAASTRSPPCPLEASVSPARASRRQVWWACSRTRERMPQRAHPVGTCRRMLQAWQPAATPCSITPAIISARAVRYTRIGFVGKGCPKSWRVARAVPIGAIDT